MTKRTHGSANESLAEALSRVMVTRDEADHRENFAWATHEGRGDRMPRFLERAIEDVPHAARQSAGRRYQGRTRHGFARTTFVLSSVAIAVGVCVSLASPSSIAPLLDTAHHVFSKASAGMTFASNANAATPRLAFGEALLNYSGQAALQAARGDIYVSDLAPGTILSAGRPVSDTAWSLPQSELDKLVITFPNGAPASAMRATVEIPGNTAASSGKFSVEMRQANEGANPAPVPAPEPAVDDAVDGEPAVDPDHKPVVKARSTDAPKTVKRKVKPSAAVKPRKTDEFAAAKTKNTDAKAAAILAAAKSVKPAATTVVKADSGSASSGPSIMDLIPTWSGSSSPNALTLFSLGGPVTE